MRTFVWLPASLLLVASAVLGFDPEELEFCRRRSEVLADLRAGEKVIYEGETGNLDFRLTDLQAAVLDGRELMLLRNSVFAQYGYIFRSGTLQEHFMEFPWYSSVHEDVSQMLSDTDRWNIMLLQYYEERLENAGSMIPEGISLAGFWHGSASVGSGYSERFLLFDSGRFIYRENSMDGSARLMELSGEWHVDGSHLVLEADSAVYLEGGDIIEPCASWGSSYVIEGPERVQVELQPPLVLRMPLEAYTPDYAQSSGDEECGHLTVPYVRIGLGGYWRMHEDPGMEHIQ